MPLWTIKKMAGLNLISRNCRKQVQLIKLLMRQSYFWGSQNKKKLLLVKRGDLKPQKKVKVKA